MCLRGIVIRPLPHLNLSVLVGVLLIVAALVGLTAACGPSDESGGSTTSSTTSSETAMSEPVQTDAGPVSGVPGQQYASTTVFKGIPYAAPPPVTCAGDRRSLQIPGRTCARRTPSATSAPSRSRPRAPRCLR